MPSKLSLIDVCSREDATAGPTTGMQAQSGRVGSRLSTQIRDSLPMSYTSRLEQLDQVPRRIDRQYLYSSGPDDNFIPEAYASQQPPPWQPSHRRQCECGSTRRDRPLLALEIWLECRGEPGMHPVVRLLRPGIPCVLDRLIGLKTAGLSECRATAGYRQRSHRTRA